MGAPAALKLIKQLCGECFDQLRTIVRVAPLRDYRYRGNGRRDLDPGAVYGAKIMPELPGRAAA